MNNYIYNCLIELGYSDEQSAKLEEIYYVYFMDLFEPDKYIKDLASFVNFILGESDDRHLGNGMD